MSESERSKINFTARAKWEDVKAEFKKFCEMARSPLSLRFHEEANELIIERVHDGFVAKRLRFEYDSLVPQIMWSCCDPDEQRGIISFRVVGNSVVYLADGRVTFLQEIVRVLSPCVAGDV